MQVPAHQDSSACLAWGRARPPRRLFSCADDEERDGRSRRECQHPWTVKFLGVIAKSPVSKGCCCSADGIRAAGCASPSVNAQELRDPDTR